MGTKYIREAEVGKVNQLLPIGFSLRLPASGQFLYLDAGHILVPYSNHVVFFSDRLRAEWNMPMGSPQDNCSYISQPQYPLV